VGPDGSGTWTTGTNGNPQIYFLGAPRPVAEFGRSVPKIWPVRRGVEHQHQHQHSLYQPNPFPCACLPCLCQQPQGLLNVLDPPPPLF
jgi:hypothetical protein